MNEEPTVLIVGGSRRPPRLRGEAPSVVRPLRLSPQEQERIDLAARLNRQNFSDFARDAMLTAAEDTLEGLSPEELAKLRT